jgi:SAM-dependent methyltransferase
VSSFANEYGRSAADYNLGNNCREKSKLISICNMISDKLPYPFRKVLFGDRKKFGLSPKVDDRDWIIWQERSVSDFYQNTQLKGIGNWVSRLAYPIIENVDFMRKKVLEIGPGVIRHLQFIKNKPLNYTICDVRREVLEISRKQLFDAEIPCEDVLLNGESSYEFPFPDKSFDIIISFNCFEHLHPLDEYLYEMKRVLVNGGLLVGSIPCEGGLAWGLGRLLTTRKYVHKNYGINYDKIICWEHPNFATYIIEILDRHFDRKYLKFHPFPFLPIDVNLTASFFYKKT